MPLPTPPTQRRRAPARELLFKGVVCALIGAVLLLGPHLARSESVRDLMRQAHLVGWFALVLGAALVLRFLWLHGPRGAARRWP